MNIIATIAIAASALLLGGAVWSGGVLMLLDDRDGADVDGPWAMPGVCAIGLGTILAIINGILAVFL